MLVFRNKIIVERNAYKVISTNKDTIPTNKIRPLCEAVSFLVSRNITETLMYNQ